MCALLYLKTRLLLFIFIFSPGIGSNPNQPPGYSVRMDNTLPLVTQAPAIQPLPLRPGVIAQVRVWRPELKRFHRTEVQDKKYDLQCLFCIFRILLSKIFLTVFLISYYMIFLLVGFAAAVVQQDSTDPCTSMAAGASPTHDAALRHCLLPSEERGLGVR